MIRSFIGGVAVVAWLPIAFGAETRHVDISLNGTPSDAIATASVSVSDDGRYVAFASTATDLVPLTPAGGYEHVYVRDMVAGITSIVDRLPGGAIPTASSGYPCITADGRYIAFQSSAALVASDFDGVGDVFLFDRQTQQFECMSVNFAGIALGGRIYSDGYSAPQCVLSGDGRFVAFETNAPLSAADVGAQFDVYVRDRALHQTILVSATATGASGNGNSFGSAMSANGNVVAFRTTATDLAGAAAPGLYAKELTTGALTRLDALQSGTPIAGYVARNVAISADGLHFAFEVTGGNAILGDQDADIDIYAVDLPSHTVEWISRPPSLMGSFGPCVCPMISADGRYVVYSSSVQTLVPWDVNLGSPPNNSFDVFLRDRATLRSMLLDVSNEVVQPSSGSATYCAISSDARFVAFASTQSGLVQGVNDNGSHVYLRDRAGFANMGFGIAGITGIPALSGSGSLGAGGSGQITLSNAASNAPSLLMISLAHGLTIPSGPLQGSVLVTSAPVLVVSLATDAVGGIALPYMLPGSAALVPEAYAQCATLDAAGAHGASLSNALYLGFQ